MFKNQDRSMLKSKIYLLLKSKFMYSILKSKVGAELEAM
jgi:hypothetical protein